MPRALPRQVTGPIVGILARAGVTPNMLTTGQLIGGIIAGAVIAGGELVWGGVLMLAFAALDAIDGTLARTTGKVTRFGGVFDSVIDRLFEGAVLGGVLYYYLTPEGKTESVLAFVSIVGSLSVSYVRARAQAEGVDLLEGLFTRPVRIILLAAGLILDILGPVLWVMAVMTILTTGQRLALVWLKLRSSDSGGTR